MEIFVLNADTIVIITIGLSLLVLFIGIAMLVSGIRKKALGPFIEGLYTSVTILVLAFIFSRQSIADAIEFLNTEGDDHSTILFKVGMMSYVSSLITYIYFKVYTALFVYKESSSLFHTSFHIELINGDETHLRKNDFISSLAISLHMTFLVGLLLSAIVMDKVYLILVSTFILIALTPIIVKVFEIIKMKEKDSK